MLETFCDDGLPQVAPERERQLMNHVFSTVGCKRYRYPTHTNELVYDRSAAKCSEVFLVILEPGEAPPLHVHNDTEQVFYITEGHGTLTVGKDKAQRQFRVESGNVVLIPPGTPHSIRSDAGGRLCYVSVDCFGAAPREEATWDEHVRVVCQKQGWDYNQIVGGKK